MYRVTDINIVATTVLPAPEQLRQEIIKGPEQGAFVRQSRKEIQNIIFGDDARWLCVVGPCSIHDVEAGYEYAQRLARVAEKVSDRLLLVMRIYFEKPRTTVGWKGLIMDPDLDGKCDIARGLRLARRFLSDVIKLKVPTATELLDPITPQYIADLISWSAIGARTTESQIHRQMASGLSMPLGFKNSTDGNVQAAINAIKATQQPQTFLGIDQKGQASAVTTGGNPNCHIILRGSQTATNYDAASVAATEARLKTAGLPLAIMVDCSHGNSQKNPDNQPKVLQQVIEQVRYGKKSLIGCMLESNLEGDAQPFPVPKETLRYGVSITDPCIDWPTTEQSLYELYAALS